ncbi:MAG: leucine-rich repeat domain-containing protein, partial [Clostridia bacterium]|nr:leucine-rich repeat domain-containing protein [Clostridia bacterium]
MKKTYALLLISILVCAIFALALTACGGITVKTDEETGEVTITPTEPSGNGNDQSLQLDLATAFQSLSVTNLVVDEEKATISFTAAGGSTSIDLSNLPIDGAQITVYGANDLSALRLVEGENNFEITFSDGKETLSYTLTVTLPHTHDYGNLVQTRDATCTATGVLSHYYCAGCGKYFDEEKNEISREATIIPTKPHTFGSLIPEVAASCEHTGFAAHYRCSVCNGYFDGEKNPVEARALTIPESHQYGELIPAVPETCETDGTAAFYRCALCDALFDEQKNRTTAENLVLPAKHIEVIDAAVPATCTESGLTEGKHCSRCETVITEQQVLESLGHDYAAKVTPVTCTEDGYTLHTCSRCGDEYRDNEQAAVGHQFDNNDVCAVCGAAMPQTAGLVFTELDDGSYQVSGYNGTDKELYIPTTYNDCPVTKIKPFAFAGAEITSITIPNSVTTIGNGALMECAHLERITIPFIGAKARIAEDAAQYPFGYIFGSNNYEGSDEVKQKYDGDWIYYYIPSTLRAVTVTGGEIRENAFLNCTKLTSVTIGDTVSKIGANAFNNCAGLTSITLSKDIQASATNAFNGCSALRAVYYNGDIASWVSISFDSANANPLALAHNLYINRELVIFADIPEGTTTVGKYAFYGCSYLTSVTLPESLTNIEAFAFYNCYRLIKVINKSALTITRGSEDNGYVGYRVITTNNDSIFVDQNDFLIFKDKWNSYLLGYLGSKQSITLPKNIDRILSYAFYNCKSITSITVPEGITYFESYCFAGCSGLSEMTLPQSLRAISNHTFYNCTGLTSIIIPPNVSNIGEEAFSGCTNITSIDIQSKDLFSINKGAFSGCIGLTSIEIPYNTSNIYEGILSGCSSLKNITIPYLGGGGLDSYGVQKPLGYLFGTQNYSGSVAVKQVFTGNVWTDSNGTTYWDKSTVTYYIPECLSNVTVLSGNIGCNYGGAFLNCGMLKNIILGEKTEDIYKYSFSGTKSLYSVSGSAKTLAEVSKQVEVPHLKIIYGTTIPSSAFRNKQINTVTIGAQVQTIGANAFSGTGVQTLIIAENSQLTSIGDFAFEYCGLTEIRYGGDIAGWFGISGLMAYGASSKSLYIGGTKIEGTLTVPEGVTSIGSYAFCDCSGLTSITIPESVTSIGEYAFRDCSGLTSITFAERSQLTSIAEYAFSGCPAMTSITIPSSVTSIGSYAFYDCTGLTSIYYTGDVAGWCGIAGLNNLMAYGASSKSLYIGGTKIEGTLTVPEGVTSIGSSAFYKCSGLTSVTIPDSVTSIGSYAFRGCSGLTSITIPNSVTSIGAGVFSGCSSLVSMTIPFVGGTAGKTASDTYQYPFGYIFGTAYTGMAVTQYYYEASTRTTKTTYCIPSSLRSVTVTGGNILYGAFYNCSMLTSITIPAGVTSIGSSAFYKCSGLTSVTIPDSVTSIGSYAFRGCSGLTSITI